MHACVSVWCVFSPTSCVDAYMHSTCSHYHGNLKFKSILLTFCLSLVLSEREQFMSSLCGHFPPQVLLVFPSLGRCKPSVCIHLNKT